MILPGVSKIYMELKQEDRNEPVRMSSPLGGASFVRVKMPEVRGDRPDWFETTEGSRVVTQITQTKICRGPSLNTQTLKQMGHGNMGPHRVPLASAWTGNVTIHIGVGKS